MGIGVSGWPLARAVSRRGQLGVVSGTAIDSVFVRRLQDGDVGGHLRSVMQRFPIPGVAADALHEFFLPEGRPPGTPYRLLPMYQQVMSLARQRLMMLAAYVEVTLAKEGHNFHVGMNLLTKAQMPNLPTLYGAMLAGVDYILMGAGIPREIPGALDALAAGREAQLRLDVEDDASGVAEYIRFDPGGHFEGSAPPALQRPKFLAIVSSHLLATVLARKATGRVDGFVIEGPTAGGHNAPPRGDVPLNERGEPVYGVRDEVDLARVRDLGVPFWIAGGAGHPERVREALAQGAAGVQVGGLFAFCDESGIEPGLRRSVVEHAARGEVDVFTDPLASPTGYPFKVVHWPGDPSQAAERERLCDLGYLRVAYRKPSGDIGYRCSSEPEAAFVAKGGDLAETAGRRCLCNSLMATVGHAQVRANGTLEPPLVTGGDDLKHLADFLGARTHYSAGDVIDWLLSNGREGS
jgi:NAD(P)H-dependent flavin oxidoreductase YrpB (nitropropane dioxygenase family)